MLSKELFKIAPEKFNYVSKDAKGVVRFHVYKPDEIYCSVPDCYYPILNVSSAHTTCYTAEDIEPDDFVKIVREPEPDEAEVVREIYKKFGATMPTCGIRQWWISNAGVVRDDDDCDEYADAPIYFNSIEAADAACEAINKPRRRV